MGFQVFSHLPLFRGVLFAFAGSIRTAPQPRAPRAHRAAPQPPPHDELGTNARHACWEGAQGHNLKTLRDTFSNGALSQQKEPEHPHPSRPPPPDDALPIARKQPAEEKRAGMLIIHREWTAFNETNLLPLFLPSDELIFVAERRAAMCAEVPVLALTAHGTPILSILVLPSLLSLPSFCLPLLLLFLHNPPTQPQHLLQRFPNPTKSMILRL